MTDWYPVGIYVEVPHNRFCKTLYCRPSLETVRRRMRRRTSSRASDKYPVQSGLLCAGNYYVSGNYKCNLRFTLETEYIAQCPEKRAPGLKQPIGWVKGSDPRLCELPRPVADGGARQWRQSHWLRSVLRTHEFTVSVSRLLVTSYRERGWSHSSAGIKNPRGA